MGFVFPVIRALLVKSFLISLFVSNVRGIPTNEQCASQIDENIAKFTAETRTRTVIINNIEPCSTCNATRLLDIARDPDYPIQIKEVEGGIQYSVVTITKNYTRTCHCKVNATVDGVVDLFYSTIFDNPAAENCDGNSTVNIVENNANADVPGLIPAPDKAAALLTCAPSVKVALKIMVQLAQDVTKSKQVDLFLNGQGTGARNKYTIFVDNEGKGRITDYEFPVGAPTSYKNWCEGSKQNEGLKDLCGCLLGTNAGLSTFVKILFFFLPCYVNTNEGYRVIIDALTCT